MLTVGQEVKLEEAEAAARRLALTFLYLRTKTSVRNAREARLALGDALAELVFVLYPFDYDETWHDGFVLRLHTTKRIPEIVKILGSALQFFDAWAIHNGLDQFAESTGSGLLARCFSSPGPVVQLFLTFGDRDKDQDATALGIRTLLKAESAPAFHFSGGRIILMRGSQSPAAIIARLRDTWKNRYSLIVVGAQLDDEESLPNRNTLSWGSLDLSSFLLTFGNNGGID